MFRLVLFMVAFQLLCFASFPQTKSIKRGIAYGYHSTEDLSALSRGIAWWYNWYFQPENEVINSYRNFGFDYVPMAWNGNFEPSSMRSFLSAHPDVKYILGWNEPNFKSQANMTPSQAASRWKEIEKIADDFKLKIVGPAVNYCGDCVAENGVIYSDPVKYLDDFFAACSGCRVDYIAVHCYMGNVSALQWYIGLFKKYGKPVWLTEFANWENNPTLQNQKNFMVGAIDYLENDPDVFRYAWFTGRYSGAPYIGLLENGQSGKLTELGQIYVNMPLHDTAHYETLPAQLEAEKYNSMSGILLELTGDLSGNLNAGYIEAGDWLEYGIEVPLTDTYDFSIRTAGTQNSSIQILMDGAYLKDIYLPSTGGWQIWHTINSSLFLLSGKHFLRIKANAAGFNLNWFRFDIKTGFSAGTAKPFYVDAYFNPAGNDLIINSSAKLNSVDIVSLTGQIIYHGKTDIVHCGFFASGMYLLRITFPSGEIYSKKIVKR
jgi:hypothetical protein